MRREWDHIIVGAGSAGATLAGRLSTDPDRSVLLLEAGGWDRSPIVRIPGFVYNAIRSEKLNWHFLGDPDPTLDGRVLKWAAGKAIGGGSSINGMVYVRGLRSDFARWAEAAGDAWGWDGLLPHFRALEHWHGTPHAARGTQGPVQVRTFCEPNAATLSVLNGFVSHGTPYVADYNAGIDEGIGLTQGNQANGLRCSAADAYIHPARKRSNLTIRTGTRVLRLIVEGNRCAGVVVADGSGETELRCSGEVILSAGAISSPKLLMLSGIGDPAQLAEHDIPVRLALPGVGADLNDHVNCFVTSSVDVMTYNAWRKGPRKAVAGLRWLIDREGPASTTANHVQAFMKTDPGLPFADVQVQTMATSSPGGDARQAVTSVISLCRPEVRGRIGLRSDDPSAAPRIAMAFLSNERDLRTLTSAARQVRDIHRAGPGHQYAGQVVGGAAQAESDADWLAYFRATSHLNWHPTSTCRMGNGPMDVVDPTLRVHGLAGLRIADASIMPTVTGGNTNAPCIMIGEKAADLILRGDASNRMASGGARPERVGEPA